MRIGITTVVTDLSMGPDRLAREVEERGFASLYVPEHTHLPVHQAEPPSLVGGVRLEDYRRTLDPLVALAAAATVTERITLGTGVLLVAQHDPIVLAKQLATLDRLARGRIVLGVGYGWNRAEAADHGVDFARRRDIAREKLLCMRALWSEEEAEFHGDHVELPPCFAWPKPVQQPRLRTLFGGAAGPALAAAVAELGDGWMPIGGAGIGPARLELRRALARAGRDPDTLEIVPFGTLPDPAKLEHLAEVGCTEVVLRVPSGGGDDEVRAVLDDYTRFLP
ncbi:MAG TPA: TIGR03619 family F420-dependent LLM class oxidoreductase [Acidimicrobiales bacterium]|nr:TIGR03619 family F420-dependent LLM class oxidoreductase [Acidimicrobiales bacterium]